MSSAATLELVDGGAETPTFFRSRLLQVQELVHCFATRRGGVSEGSFASLNFGLKGGDDPDHVAANLERLARRLGFDARRFYRVRQVHGRTVQVVGRSEDPAAVGSREADALVTDEPGVAVGVLTADCVPVLLFDPERRVVAAAHAGWRGVAGGVLEATVEVMVRDFGARPSALRAAIGPSIGPCCYEVGPEVAARFAAVPGGVIAGRGERPHLDLPWAVEQALHRLGLDGGHLARCTSCTRCTPDLLFSYRRDGSRSGHHLSVIGLSAPARPTPAAGGTPRRR